MRTQRHNKRTDWPIDNALGCLREAKNRAQGMIDAEPESDFTMARESQVLSMNYAISVVESINTMTPPAPPTFYEDFLKMTKGFRRGAADALDSVAEWVRAPNIWDED